VTFNDQGEVFVVRSFPRTPQARQPGNEGSTELLLSMGKQVHQLNNGN
jgi:hypothetical protein